MFTFLINFQLSILLLNKVNQLEKNLIPLKDNEILLLKLY